VCPSLANMVANRQESRIPPRTACKSWQFRPALNLPEVVFSTRIHPPEPGDHMLSQKFLVDVSLDPFTCVNRLSVAKSARPILILLALLLSAPLPWGQVHTVVLGAFLLWNHCSCWGPRKSSYIAILCRALSDQLAASDLWQLRACPPHPTIYTIAWTRAQQILLILPLQHPQRWLQQICNKQSTIDRG
jgi:hypothetical protein